MHWNVKEGRLKIGERAELTNASANTTAPTRTRVSYPPVRRASGCRDYERVAHLIRAATRTASRELLGHILHGSGRRIDLREIAHLQKGSKSVLSAVHCCIYYLRT